MKFPFSWLKELLNFSQSPEEIGDALNNCGIEVDSIKEEESLFEKVIVGLVKKVSPHPQAEKLVIAQVWDGNEELQVVCGAPNCKEGLLTAFAKVGAKIKDENGKVHKIKKSKLRNIESFGMLCSEKELGISESHEGIMDIKDPIEPGTDLKDLHGEIIFEVSLTPNLNHCSSVFGVARELSACLGLSATQPSVSNQSPANNSIHDHLQVHVENTDNCPRYSCRIIQGVTIAPSPKWLQQRLIACGQRPINNIVDATNYVLMELGHPLHAFDLNRLEGKKIIVKDVKDETFTTLDGLSHKIEKESLCICDEKKPIALAGIMGGKNSEVDENTKDIVIESAYFLPSPVRKVSKSLGIQTEGSKRFERGCNPNQVLLSLERVCSLIQEIAGGSILEDFVDIKKQDFLDKKISLRVERVNAMLGTNLSIGEVEDIFSRLQFPITHNHKDQLQIQVPTYRVDINEEIDLVEEVARFYGFDNIPKKTPKYQSSSLPHAPIYTFEKNIRKHLLRQGMQEFLCCNLISHKMAALTTSNEMPERSLIAIKNPNSIENSVLRPSLFSGLLQVAKTNSSHQKSNVHGFEIGRIHFKAEDSFKEQSVVGIILMGSQSPGNWSTKEQVSDFYDLKGVVENLLEALGHKKVNFNPSNQDSLHPGRQASVKIANLDIGILGEIHPKVLRQFDIKKQIFFAELNLNDLLSIKPPQDRMQSLPLYPGMQRDWTLTLKSDSQVDNVVQAIASMPSKILQQVHVLDVYQSDSLGEGKRNVTFRLSYRDAKKTLSQKTLENEHTRICTETEKKIQYCLAT
jgi:phenylalanyl-tRNA synthetase beta chain